MTRLPEKGDVKQAIAVWNERLAAATGTDDTGVATQVGDIEISDGEMTGEGATTLRLMYGDLLDVAETMEEAGSDVISCAVKLLVSGKTDLHSELANVFLQGVGLGVLMERARS